MSPQFLYRILLLPAFCAAWGCQHIGPQTIRDDRITYNDAVVSSWKQQTLLNIVRLRYIDVPEFVDVPSIVNGFENERSGAIGWGTELYPQDTPSTFWGMELGGSRTWIDRPTISYTPQTGSEFIRNLTHPIPPLSILNLIESGNPADVVLELAVDSINGIRNRSSVGGVQAADPEFAEIIRILQNGQASGCISLRTTAAGSSEDAQVVLFIRSDKTSPQLAEELQRLRTILGLDPELREFKVVFGMLPSAPNEIAIRTRSVLRIMTYLALFVDVPANHLAEGRAPDVGLTEQEMAPPLTVHSGCERPCDTYAAVCYQGYWFWIDPCDSNSKRSMVYLKLLLALADTMPRNLAPALTIQAN